MKLLIFMFMSFELSVVCLPSSLPCEGELCSKVISMPLVDNMKASLKADIDVSQINKYLKAYIKQEINTEIRTIMKDVVEEIIDNITSSRKEENVKLKDKRLNESCSSTRECRETLTCENRYCKCSGTKHWNGLQCLERQPTECADIASDKDGVYTIIPKGSSQEISVFCIMRGANKWTVIQRRINGKEDFYKTWSDYKSGFGTVQTEYWLGNDNIHFISANGDHDLSVYVEDFNGRHAYANYSHFAIGDGSTKYLLNITGFVGDAGDGLTDGDGMKFSTKDSDNDKHSGNCAHDRHAGWWFRSCDYANLNGRYNDTQGAGNYWYRWRQNTKPVKKSIMMIKRK